MRKRGGTAALAHRRDVRPRALTRRTAQETQHVTAYPKPASGAPKFPELEAEVLKFWDSDDTFRSSIQQREGAPE